MIEFHYVTYRNFLSCGNNPITISLNEKPTTLVVGQNGAGKSTMLDAITFALFGKPYRNINKPQLVNTVNNKGCLVEIEFQTNNTLYKVVRGMKPNVFEIYQNGTLLDQDAKSRDYQKHLEQNILKMNSKSFQQIVVLGSASFMPFMQLTPMARRAVIEDLLDIHIFSKMTTILKEKRSTVRSMMNQNDSRIEVLKAKIEGQKRLLNTISQSKENLDQQNQAKIAKITDDVMVLIEQNRKIEAEMAELSMGLDDSKAKVSEKTKSFSRYRTVFGQKISDTQKQIDFFHNNQTCPTCAQSISEDLANHKIKEHEAELKKFEEAKELAEQQLSAIEKISVELKRKSDKIASLNVDYNSNRREMQSAKKRIESLQKSNESEEDSSYDLNEENATLVSLLSSLEDATNENSRLAIEITKISVAQEILKDTGIKSTIIRQYIPVINKLVNQFLATLDFYVSFTLDENFSETIKSRHRDNFTYDSFSEGEKMKIDLALLFAWRAVANMKNSASTNLLILDETFDSSLDANGIGNLLTILYQLSSTTNVFIISHKEDLLDGKFSNKLTFHKRKNFSYCEQTDMSNAA